MFVLLFVIVAFCNSASRQNQYYEPSKNKEDIGLYNISSGLYFPMTNVFTRVRRGTQDVVFQSVALMEHGEPTEDEIVYRIADGDGSAMIMNAATGQLRLSTHSEEGKYKLTVTAELRNSRIFQSTTVKVSILPRADHCSLQAKDVCFWETADYQVYENRVSTYVGYLGPGSGCQYSPTRYRLLNGTEYLEIKDAEIFTRSDGGKILDREVIPFFIVTVACEYKNTKLNRTLRVTVLDEDDNPPYMQTRASDIYVKPGEKVETDVMFLDKDVVGEHVVTILGDHRHILNVSQSVYNTPLTVVEGKVVNCRVYTTRPANASALPYSVTLRMNNTSLLPGYGVSHVDMPLVLRTAEPRALAQSSEVTYNETSLTVTRDAAPYTRITQPLEAVTLEGLSGPVFEMDNAAFGVTKKAGIVYVKNETALKAAPNQTSVTINWTHEGGSEGTVQLLITISSASCKPNVTHINGWPICAETKSYKNCVSNCGLGVGKVKKNGISRCEWRGERKPIDKNLNRNYSTCTPDIQTCPDGWCDPLEKSALGICPQDCTHDVVGGNMHPTKKMGVYSGVGVCSCEVFQFEKCSCGPMNRYLLSRDNKGNATSPSTPQVIMKPDISHYTTPPPDIAAMKSVQSSKCGAICLAGIVACSVFVTGAFAVLLMACRSRIHGKGWRRERKLANSVTFAGHDATRQSTDTLLLTFDPATPTPTESNTTPANDASNSLTPDPKWEFPRERLTIEQCLGEGEFGRVLKATALDIAGSKGYTSVAVKTLKEDASAGELGDLISEYKMLKEVSHPNVIKLLGASTIPGGPIYIIIEFSEHGSLRNYLRRSRHMGTDGTQASSSFSTSSTPSVTARDVLSFAWQISKGMAYLTDIKLVHRDLAARNVLLATGKVCKISDFGLTRDVYEDDAYLKRSKGRVPVKWMALESLSDHVYTSKTDVWSFGVLLWELVTLGASPYPGVAVHNLFYLLRAGYRMEKPENCSDELYNIMRSCWVEDPMERPPFKQVTAILEQMLADGTEYLNLDLNSRMAVNRAYFTDLPEDNLDFQITNFNYKVPRRQPKEVADNAVARSYVNGQVTAVQYENEKVPAEATELERYESPIRVINTTLSTQPPASYVPMSPKTTLVTES